METVHILYTTGRWLRRFASARWLMLGMLWFAAVFSLRADSPAFYVNVNAPSFVAPPDLMTYPGVAVLLVTNCSDNNYDYSIQHSTNLHDWTGNSTLYGAWNPGHLGVAYPSATSGVCFYRAVMIPNRPIPVFKFAIAAGTNINVNGKNFLANSFDSGDAYYSSYFTNAFTGTNGVWIYDPSKSKSGGDVATDTAVTGNVSLGNATINGHLFTGPGTATDVVQLGPHGTVGDAAFSASNTGIEGLGTATSWWQANFNVTFPTVKAPTFSGNVLPPVTTTGTYAGFIVIPQGGVSDYISVIDPGKPLCITGPTTLWVKSSLALGVTIAPTNNASLILYVGTANGAGDSLTLLSGIGTMNQPGYARNLQIYGLPSLNSIDMHGNAGWTATVYAPQGDVMVGGGGNNVQETTGAIVCRGLMLKGHWRFHFDESLKLNGPTY